MVVRQLDRGLWPFAPGSILYHGSRGGIDGDIRPVSRPRTDFGSGFYMGSDSLQAKALAINPQAAYAYSLVLDGEQLEGMTVLELGELEWALTILHNRRSVPSFNGSALDIEIGRLTDGADFLVGPIGDDRMSAAVDLFERGALTDQGLVACLARVPYGYQAVAKTERACRALEIVSAAPIHEDEADQILDYSRRMQRQARDTVRDVTGRYAGIGRNIDELLADSTELERLAAIDLPGDVAVFPSAGRQRMSSIR